MASKTNILVTKWSDILQKTTVISVACANHFSLCGHQSISGCEFVVDKTSVSCRLTKWKDFRCSNLKVLSAIAGVGTSSLPLSLKYRVSVNIGIRK